MANLQFKLGYKVLSPQRLKLLTESSHFVDQILNRTSSRGQPFVGASAFAHKGGVHVNAVLKNRLTYEHMDPRDVGNTQRILLSDLAGSATIKHIVQRLGLKDLAGSEPALLQMVKTKENQGYQYEDAEASSALLVLRSLSQVKPLFDLNSFQVVDKRIAGGQIHSEATVSVKIQNKERVATASGVGPVHALDQALRQCLLAAYPQLNAIRLTDYKVRVLSSGTGTGSMVRVHIEFSDGNTQWNTVGVSENIIQASFEALVDGLEYYIER